MDIYWLIEEFDIKCNNNKSERFNKGNDLKQHCNDAESWWHRLLMYYIVALYEIRPDRYEDDIKKLKPVCDNTLSDGSSQSSDVSTLDTSVHNVKG